jgi:hypothetical protein
VESNQLEIESLGRERVRLGLWIAFCFVVVLCGIAANDFLVHAGRARSISRLAALAVILAGGMATLAMLGRFMVLLRRSLKDARLRRMLWDELASANHTQSMVITYLAMLILLIVLAVVAMFSELSGAWVVNGLLFTAFATQAGSFAWLERRGGDGG